jgi:hypothetical protein
MRVGARSGFGSGMMPQQPQQYQSGPMQAGGETAAHGSGTEMHAGPLGMSAGAGQGAGVEGHVGHHGVEADVGGGRTGLHVGRQPNLQQGAGAEGHLGSQGE